MKKEEAREEFNKIPIEYRTVIIANELSNQIQWLEIEKINSINEHRKRMAQYNDKINNLEKELNHLTSK